MKKTILFVLSILACSATAQEAPVTTPNLFSVTILLPGLEYETALSEKTTLDFRVAMGFGYASGTYRETEFGIFPSFHAQYRYFYNFAKRIEKEKHIANNSGNYIALHTGLYSGNPIIGDLAYNADYMAEAGPVWGIQRVYNSGFKLDLHLGAGLGFNDLDETYLSPLIGFRLGWLLSN